MSRRFSLTLSLVLLVWGCGEDESAVPASSPDYATPARPSYTRGSAPAKVPVIPFEEVAAEAGIDFVHTNGAFGDKWMPETMGSGVAFDDLDADGDPEEQDEQRAPFEVIRCHWLDARLRRQIDGVSPLDEDLLHGDRFAIYAVSAPGQCEGTAVFGNQPQFFTRHAIFPTALFIL